MGDECRASLFVGAGEGSGFYLDCLSCFVGCCAHDLCFVLVIFHILGSLSSVFDIIITISNDNMAGLLCCVGVLLLVGKQTKGGVQNWRTSGV